MAASVPLDGIELIDCAKANAKQGIATAAELCGYGQDINRFQATLQSACEKIGVHLHTFSDLITDQQTLLQQGGEDIAPDTPSQL